MLLSSRCPIHISEVRFDSHFLVDDGFWKLEVSHQTSLPCPRDFNLEWYGQHHMEKYFYVRIYPPISLTTGFSYYG